MTTPETASPYRPLSGTEQSWYRAVPTGTGITVLSLHLSRPIPTQNLQNAIHKLVNYHPALSSTLTPTSLCPLPSPPQIQNLTLANPNLSSIIELELNENPWAEADRTEPVPTLFATVYNDSFLVLRLHTAVCDRVSAAAVVKELMGMLAGKDGAEAEVEEGRGSLGIEDLIRKEDSWKPFWARGKDLVGYSVNGLRSSGLSFRDAGSDRRSEMVRLVVGEVQTRKLLAACKAKGVELSGALAAAALIATYSSKHLENNQPETYSMVTLINCRKFLDPVLTDKDVGFYHSGIVNTHTIDGKESLWGVAVRIHNAYTTAMSNKKHLTDIGDLNFLMCKAIDNPQLTPSSSLRTALITIFEEPLVYESSEVDRDLGVVDYVGCASVHGVGPSIAVFDTIRDGKLDCAFVYPSPLHSREQVSDLVGHMERILTEGSHGGDDDEVTAK